jgi:opacity protein-like surface antigen
MKTTLIAGIPLALTAQVLTAQVASAADLPVKAPPRVAWVDSWAGPYIGAYFGAGAGRATEFSTGTSEGISRSVTNGVVTSNSSFSDTTASNLAGDMTGSMVDLFAGYNWRAGNFVAGGQIEGTVFSDVALRTTGIQTFDFVGRNLPLGTVTSTSSNTSTVLIDQQLRSRVGLIGRIGFLARPDMLLYGLGGLEFGHFTLPDGADPFGGNNNKWVAGYTAGAGGEVKLTDNWSLRTEYRYLHFGFHRSTATSSATSDVAGPFTFVTTNNQASTQHTNANFHVGKIGLVYQFGDTRPLSAMAAIPAASGAAWGDSWAGPYIGAYFGAGAGRARETSTRTQSESSISSAGSVSAGAQTSAANLAGDMTGSMVDLFAGYNWRTGSFVAGGQLEGTLFSDVKSQTIGNETFTLVQSLNGGVTSTSSGTRSADNRQHLRSNVAAIGRAGYLATPNLLLYGLGGLALGHFAYPDNYPHVSDEETRVGGKNGKWVAGYTAGAGGELKLTDNWSLRGEYRYLHFGFDRNEPANGSQTSAGGTARSTNSVVGADQC